VRVLVIILIKVNSLILLKFRAKQQTTIVYPDFCVVLQEGAIYAILTPYPLQSYSSIILRAGTTNKPISTGSSMLFYVIHVEFKNSKVSNSKPAFCNVQRRHQHLHQHHQVEVTPSSTTRSNTSSNHLDTEIPCY
jgi:hypothetical protein